MDMLEGIEDVYVLPEGLLPVPGKVEAYVAGLGACVHHTYLVVGGHLGKDVG